MSHITVHEPRGAHRARLTRAEYRCAQLAGQGMLSKEIAEELGCKYGTVKTHLFNACQKLGIHSRFVLAMRLREGLADRFLPKDLSQRQHEAIAAIAGGDCYKVVAERLGISVYTLKGRLSAVTRKLGVAPREMRNLVSLDSPTQGDSMQGFYMTVGWRDAEGRQREERAELGEAPTSEEVCNQGAALYRLLTEQALGSDGAVLSHQPIGENDGQETR